AVLVATPIGRQPILHSSTAVTATANNPGLAPVQVSSSAPVPLPTEPAAISSTDHFALNSERAARAPAHTASSQAPGSDTMSDPIICARGSQGNPSLDDRTKASAAQVEGPPLTPALAKSLAIQLDVLHQVREALRAGQPKKAVDLLDGHEADFR